ncbi:hypothetical protein [uncultured Bacteroides sp.]|uniref:hypothetical protein n=1 Tax=uncultured Bacteroides sp. TaxID=162156 RepID=UPI00261D1383|nr:hypothetical protein [uncultured Bacteroides sp.]
MKIKALLSILLFVVGILSVDAGNPFRRNKGFELEDSLMVDSTGRVVTTKVKKKKVFVRPERIDRGIMEEVFIPKGQWMAGGTISYSEHNEDNLNFIVLKDIDARGYDFTVNVYGGYFIKNNVAAGLRMSYNRTYQDLGNFELNLGEDFNIALDNVYYLQHEYNVAGFIRTYMPIGHSKIFGLFNEARITYGYARGKNSTGSGTQYDGTFQTVHSLGIGIAPGMSAFITNWSAVEVSVGVMGFDFNWVKQRTNQVEHGKRRTSSGNFKINLFSINIGMTFYL